MNAGESDLRFEFRLANCLKLRRNCGGFYRVSVIWDFFSHRGCDARELVDVGVVLSCSCRADLVAASTAEVHLAILGTRIALLRREEQSCLRSIRTGSGVLGRSSSR